MGMNMFVRKSKFNTVCELYENAVRENAMLWKRLHDQATKPAFKGGAWRDKDGKFASAKKSGALL